MGNKKQNLGEKKKSLSLLWVAWLAFLLHIVFMQGETRQAFIESPLIFHILVTIFNYPRTSMLFYCLQNLVCNLKRRCFRQKGSRRTIYLF